VPLAASVGDVGKTQRENPLENHGKMGMKAKKLDFYSFFLGHGLTSTLGTWERDEKNGD
jgi:hypothetical protein